MSTQFDSYSYHLRPSISPPVSPKTLPHGFKRKASTQDDEVENPAQIYNSFKKLRLKDGRHSSRTETNPPAFVYREVEPFAQPSNSLAPPFGSDFNTHNHDEDDYMGVDDTNDRIWIHDLDAEIKEIEAQEAQESSGMQIVDTGKDYSRIPDHILKHSPKVDDAASNMQMILYRDPVSISVPQEEDAVRKAIIEARRRVRERQQEENTGLSHMVSEPEFGPQRPSSPDNMLHNTADDGMDID